MASDENFWPQARAALETRSWKSPSAPAWKFCRVWTLFNVIHVFDPNWSPGWSNSKFNNTLKTNDINNNIQNHDSKIVYRHIQGWTICSLAVYHWFGCQSVYNARANKRHRYRIFDCGMLFYFIYFMGNRLYINVIICKYLQYCLQYCLYNDITLALWCHKLQSHLLFVQHALANNKETSKLSHQKRNYSCLTLWDYPCQCTSLTVWEIVFCDIVITVMTHKHHGARSHCSLDNLLNSMPWLRAKEISKHFNWGRNHL